MLVMTQVLKKGDGPNLLYGLSMENTYTEEISGSNLVAAVVKNLVAILITITKGVKVAQVVTANVVLPVELSPGTLEVLDETQGIQ